MDTPVWLERGSKSTPLLNGQESQRGIQANVTVDALFLENVESTFLTGLEAEESARYTGLATASRLARTHGYSNDRLTALAQWVAEFESWVNGRQGEGITLIDSDRDREISGVIPSLSWSRTRGELFQVDWSLEFIRGNGLLSPRDSSPYSVNPGGRSSLDGLDMGDLRTWQTQRTQNFEVYPRIFAPEGENDISAQTGAWRTVTVQGRFADRTEFIEFDNHVRSLSGSNETVEYESAFPGRTTEVMVRDYESTRSSGAPSVSEYTIEIIQGESF